MNKLKYLIELPKEKNYASTRDGFGEALLTLGAKNEKIVALSADLTESTRVLAFAARYPLRHIQVGVAEQNLAGIAAGLAAEGYIPFAASFAAFSPGRNWDQLRVSICYSKLNVKLIGAHAGLTTGEDGATHQMLEDIALTRVLPNLTVVVPADAIQAAQATVAVAEHNGPCYLRLGRAKVLTTTNTNDPFTIGKAVKITSGKDATIIACGVMVERAISAAERLSSKYAITVINMHTIKPIDTQAILDAAKNTGVIITCEEHQAVGGLGSAVAEVVAANYPIPVVRVGVKDRFGESGDAFELLDYFNLGVDDIVHAVESGIEMKKDAS